MSQYGDLTLQISDVPAVCLKRNCKQKNTTSSQTAHSLHRRRHNGILDGKNMD